MSGSLGRRAVVVGAGIGGLAMAGALAKYFERVEIFERDSLFHPAVRGPVPPRIAIRMGCSQAVSGRSARSSRGSRAILPEPALSPCRSHKKSNTSGRMSAFCQSGISVCYYSVRPDP